MHIVREAFAPRAVFLQPLWLLWVAILPKERQAHLGDFGHQMHGNHRVLILCSRFLARNDGLFNAVHCNGARQESTNSAGVLFAPQIGASAPAEASCCSAHMAITIKGTNPCPCVSERSSTMSVTPREGFAKMHISRCSPAAAVDTSRAFWLPTSTFWLSPACVEQRPGKSLHRFTQAH